MSMHVTRENLSKETNSNSIYTEHIMMSVRIRRTHELTAAEAAAAMHVH